MAVHKPKLKNIHSEKVDRIIQHHIPYELWMMRESFAAALRGASTQFQQNLQIEGLALHCRNLIEFLKNGDACAFNPADFTTDKFKVDKRFVRTKLVDKINEQISHLTDGRTEDREEKFKPDNWKEAVEAVEKEFKRWLQNLTPEWAAKWEKGDRVAADAVARLIETGAGGASSLPTFAMSRSKDQKRNHGN